MNKFEKVSFDTYCNSVKDLFYNNPTDFTEDDYQRTKQEYEDFSLPERATMYSAGYDFHAPFSFLLKPHQTITIPTGIKCELDNDKFLMLVPRSSFGFKYKARLDNTLGVVDCDFFNNEKNEGHIMIKITNENDTKELKVNKNESFAQGIILPYFRTVDDKVATIRKGGIGSTSK